ncbi:hypothetical protein [Actinokineospora globicatena]|uniref:Uncharacterized protein n=1 Tax=Actinokineospora globicatena TaxID=103729 RepID=A0A9W6V9L0_9PSEU|nr:hypothetical protein [Actinokineospora globicatena]GLW91083.1 hypothetical protein Aglo03_18990 [Actinokineospora globicatena]
MTDPYGFRRPTVADAENAIRRLHPTTADQVWTALRAKANLTGTEPDADALTALITAMEGTDPVLSLCAQAFRIRSGTHTALSAAHALVRSAE